MLIEELHDAPSPADACARLLDLPFPLLLESAARGGSMGRYSYLTADPSQIWSTHPGDDSDALEQAAAYLAAHRADPVPGLPPFQGGVAGFLGYEFGRRLERLPAPRTDDLRLPDAWLGAYDWVVAWDHLEGRTWVLAGQRGSGATRLGSGAAGQRGSRPRTGYGISSERLRGSARRDCGSDGRGRHANADSIGVHAR